MTIPLENLLIEVGGRRSTSAYGRVPGCSLQHLRVLQCLENGKILKMTDVAILLGHTTAAATLTVDYLERQGLVERQSHTDRRLVLLALTPEGQAHLDRERASIKAELQEVTA